MPEIRAAVKGQIRQGKSEQHAEFRMNSRHFRLKGRLFSCPQFRDIKCASENDLGDGHGDEEEDGDPVTWNVRFSINGTNPIRGEWYPGQVYKYEQTTPLSRLIRPYEEDWKLTNRAAFKNFNFKFEKLSFDFQVASHR